MNATIDDSEYMTVKEFAELSSDAHHAVWAAGADIDTIPFSGIRRYHRAQVLELLDPASEASA